MNTHNLGGKANNLLKLSCIDGVNVPKFLAINASSSNKSEINSKIENFLQEVNPSLVAVRSSAVNEDSNDASFAGVYHTCLNIFPNIISINEAINKILDNMRDKEEIISHYSKVRKVNVLDNDVGIIIQEMIQDPEISGVMFSHDPGKVDCYYSLSVANGLGEQIVSGTVDGKNLRIFRLIDDSLVQENWLKDLIKVFRKIEHFYKNTSLDVEFAIKNNKIFILQCRPITSGKNIPMMENKQMSQVKELIKNIQKEVNELHSGDVLGDMIDINPRELLGDSPSVLDISIFRELFGDSVVEEVRSEMGYDPLFSGLIRVIGHKPYVSLKSSAFSLRPKGISTETYTKIVDFYRNELISNPGLQSSVEFDIYVMGCGEKLLKLISFLQDKISKAEMNNVIDSFEKIDSSIENTSIKSLEELTEFLESYTNSVYNGEKLNFRDLLDLVKIGTKYFVKVARLAFYWKNRFQERYPHEDLNLLLGGSLFSITSKMHNDILLYREGRLDREFIINEYGHLRPGQFMVFGEVYKDDPEYYLFNSSNLSVEQREKELKNNAFEDNFEFKNLSTFLKAREEVKFLFMKAFGLFSDKLKMEISRFNLSREESESLTINELFDMVSNVNFGMNKEIANIKRDFIILPDVIIPDVTNLEVVKFSSPKATYITKEVVKEDIIFIDSTAFKDTQKHFQGKIVAIPNADPGFDFLFHSGIKGLVTRSGGPASHMCIRSIELNVPSCIGCGDHVFTKIKESKNIILDCLNNQIVL